MDSDQQSSFILSSQGYVNKQCLCIALYAIVFSSLIVIHRWQQEDLDLVLFLGDELYKRFNTQKYLSATDLPTNILLCNAQVQTSHLHNNNFQFNNRTIFNILLFKAR